MNRRTALLLIDAVVIFGWFHFTAATAQQPLPKQSQAGAKQSQQANKLQKPQTTDPENSTLTSAVSNRPKPNVAPTGETAWGHAPFMSGECGLCHEKSDPTAPGPITAKVDEICYECHDGMKALLASSKFPHAAAVESCTNCHNPHDSKQAKGLRQQVPDLCLECHSGIASIVKTAKTAHGALADRKSCLNCHDPHASGVEKLLVQLTYDLCVNCHGQDGMQDHQGKTLTNMKTLLASNSILHGPVAAKDCTACHQPHGGDKFRMLVLDYPLKFYSPYDIKNYELCFTCHSDEMVTTSQTTTLTGFRDGSRNLHFVHVNKAENGRTCRACHEVHAAPQLHNIRASVPYGTKGWLLPINYQKTENGGQCTKTCHPMRSYNRNKAQ